MPIIPDGEGMVLSAATGTPLADFRWREDEGEQVVSRFRVRADVSPDRVARQAVRDLAGLRVTTPVEETARALIGAGATIVRGATDMHRNVAATIPPTSLLPGWSLIGHDWDDDLGVALAAAYGPDHLDHTPRDRVSRLRELVDGEGGLPLLPGASARVREPSGRSVGQVVTVGPVPWNSDLCAWILDVAITPAAQGHGLGAALLAYAIRGTAAAGLPTVGLSVTDGNPARRLYDRMGFRPVSRVFVLRLPSA